MPKHTQKAELRFKLGGKSRKVAFPIHRDGPGWGATDAPRKKR